MQLLLPDGTVVLTGGNPDQGRLLRRLSRTSKFTLLRICSIPMAARQLGRLSGAHPTTVTYSTRVHGADDKYGHRFGRPDEGGIGHALLRHGSTLCRIVVHRRASGALTVSGPPNSNVAPPGYYMLFLVNSAGTPSLASWVQVQGPVAAVARVTFHPERVPTPKYIIQRKHVTEAPLQLRKEMHVH